MTGEGSGGGGGQGGSELLSLIVIVRSTPFPVILRSALPHCHSEERTTKNLRCWLT